MKQHTYLIVGGGMAADAAVKGIRKVDDHGEILVLGNEPDPPYQRPPLTKDLWTKDASLDSIWCATEAKGAHVQRATEVVAIDPGRHEARDDRGEIHRYEKLLLATGGSPRRLPFGEDQVIYYRTSTDFRRLEALAREGDHFAVIGGAFIGSEIAAALTVHGKKVTMIFPEVDVCARMLPAPLAAALTEYFEARGVTILSGRKPSEIVVNEGAFTLRIENGHRFSVDGIVAGIGIKPNTRLAQEAGLEVKNGIVVDEQLRTRHPDVFAAGDVANFYNPLLDRHLRVEHEDNALTMGEQAGRNMAGDEAPYHHLPFFYSDLFDVGYEAVGETDASHDIVTNLRNVEDKGMIFYMRDERVRGIVFWNLFGKVDAGRELIAAPGPHSKDGLDAWTRERLAED